ncbi:hypothetical protein OG912_32245 [Streptomyces sp. NBC_00464]|uniref:hypothetical protein n=1 Tax=Streptomyces sp. NBC_00464 TaxID=2975751 RepID=UPI002E197F08
MNLGEHAAAIEAAIKAAADDGYELDNGQGDPVHMELNRVTADRILCCVPAPVPISAPTTYIY